jgi:ribosomal protein S12 methylthiotransferase
LKTLGLVSLGCAKNRVDAEHLLGDLARDFQIVEDLSQAEVILVHTCGFIEEAVEESVQEILELARFKEEGDCETLAVTGCLPKRYPAMASELPEVDHFFTPEDQGRIPAVLLGRDLESGPYRRTRFITQPPHSTYLKIAEGCSNCCTYCTIPSIRGPLRSVPEEELLTEARSLAAAGAVELNLVAQDVTSYGSDRGDPAALCRLLKGLEGIEELRWIRLLYAYPGRMPEGLTDLLSGGGKVLPYLDSPIQHIHPRILGRMGRRTTAREIEESLLHLQRRVPGLVLRTTVIVGFPGETEEEFRALAAFIERVRFHHLGAFLYSPEDGTPAARLRGRVPRTVARERLNHLLHVQAEISAERNLELLGRELDLLVEGMDEEGRPVARYYGQAPEVDGLTVLQGLSGEVRPGNFVRGRVVDTFEYDLVAQVEARQASASRDRREDA